MPSEASVAPVVQDVGQPTGGDALEHERQRRRRRHKPRSSYDKWIRPYRRELKTGALFCLCVVLGYLLWTAVIAR